MKDRIVPVGLKGKEITDRMIALMGVSSVNENRKNSVVELTKKGPDGKVYGIVRENHEYYIKTTNKTKDLQVEDFSYIGGLKNKKSEAYSSYAKAIKHLSVKFKSLNEAYGVSDNINVFESDRLLKEDVASFYQQTNSGFGNGGNMEGSEMSECCGAPVMEGMCSECGTPSMSGMEQEGMGMDEFDKPAMDNFQDQYGAEGGEQAYYATANKQNRNPETFEKREGMGMDRMAGIGTHDEPLDEFNQAVEDMMQERPIATPRPMYENKLSIARSIANMDSIIESVVGNKKKVYTLK